MQVVADNRIKRITMPASVKTLVVDRDVKRRMLVQELLSNFGYTTTESCGEVDELRHLPRITNCGHLLVLCVGEVTDKLIDKLGSFISEYPMPVLLLSEKISQQSLQKAMRAGVSSFLALGVQGNRMQHAIDSAIAGFGVVDGLHKEIATLRSRLEDRIAIEKAKGLIAKNRKLDEKQAYLYLRNYAMKKSMKLVDVANMLIGTAELLDKSDE